MSPSLPELPALNVPASAGFDPRDLSPRAGGLLASIGQAVAGIAATAASAGDPGTQAAALAELETLGLRLQSVARVVAGGVRLAPERIDLGLALLQLRAEWAVELARRDACLHGPPQGLVAAFSAGIVKQVLELALAHALVLGREVSSDVAWCGPPPRATVRLVVHRAGGEPFDILPEQFDDLNWRLLCVLAQATDIDVQRAVEGHEVALSLGFKPSDAPVEDLAEPPDPRLPTPVPPGLRALLLEPHEATRAMAERLLRDAGVQVQSAASVDQGRAAAARQSPDVMVTGIGGDDPRGALLLGELRERNADLRVIELVDRPHRFETAAGGVALGVRVSRDDLARTLVPALSQELARP